MKKILNIVISLSILPISLIAQGKFGHVTPQTADFMKYGDVPVSQFSGKMNFEVPIYLYKDYDFDIPIQLVYSADGFKPSKRADYVGLDWTLIAGGCITREIYGAADDSQPSSTASEYGYYLTVKDGGFDKNKIWNFDPSIVHTSSTNPDDENRFNYLTKNGYDVDFQPDLFMFNFNGHSGQFMIDDNGTAKSMNRSYKIDITNFKAQMSQLNFLDNESSITITTPEGYVYIFGGDKTTLEYTIHFKDDYAPSQANPTIVAWHLSKIIAPNGRIVEFNYVNHNDDILNEITNPLWQSSETNFVKDGLGRIVNPIIRTGIAAKKSVLESIVIDNVRIEFSKSIENTLSNYNNKFYSHLYYNSPIYQLDEIKIKVNDDVVYNYKLLYENVIKRRFLKSITLANRQMYTFTYNHTEYPNPINNLEALTDIYGFWGGNNSASSYGLMSQVCYPTGGYSKFEYEKHQFEKEVLFDAPLMSKYLSPYSNSFLDSIRVLDFQPAVDEVDDMLPPIEKYKYIYVTKYRHNGARIKRITNYTTNNIETNNKEYIYNTSKDNGISSGILYQSPPLLAVQIATGNRIYAESSIYLKNYNIDESAIGYSDVFEKFNDGSYNKYIFYDWTDFPDNLEDVKFNFPYSSLKYIDGTSMALDETYNEFLVTTGHSRIASLSDKRGKLKATESYNNNNQITRSEISYYLNCSKIAERTPYDPIATPIVNESDYVLAFLSMKGGGMVKKIYLDKYHPQTQTIKTENNVISTQEIKYNEYDLPKTNLNKTSNGDFIRTDYYYPFNYQAAEPYSDMTNANILSPIVEEVVSRIKGDLVTEISRNKIEYIKKANNSFLFLPNKVFKSIGGNNLQQVISYDIYDGDGKLIQQTKDNIPVTYLWGNNNPYPIAEIINATYSNLSTALVSTTHIIEEEVDALRTSLPNAHISTYTYKPLVGILTETDPRGVTTYYEYDSLNRLKQIYIKENGEKKIIQNYDYHYWNQ